MKKPNNIQTWKSAMGADSTLVSTLAFTLCTADCSGASKTAKSAALQQLILAVLISVGLGLSPKMVLGQPTLFGPKTSSHMRLYCDNFSNPKLNQSQSFGLGKATSLLS
jgi:hypothetical protein